MEGNQQTQNVIFAARRTDEMLGSPVDSRFLNHWLLLEMERLMAR